MLKDSIYKDDLFELNTLSPNKEFYYRIRKPVSINMSNFGAEIAFFTKTGELIYHRKDTYAHWMQFNTNYEFVFFLDLRSGKYINFDLRRFENNISKYLSPVFNAESVRTEAEKLNIPFKIEPKDVFTENFFKKWHPKYSGTL